MSLSPCLPPTPYSLLTYSRLTECRTYGDGAKSSGPVYTDSVTMAGITADQQYFSPVTSVSESFGKDPEDGILGMAFQTISELNEPPWFQNVGGMAQGRHAQPKD